MPARVPGNTQGAPAVLQATGSSQQATSTAPTPSKDLPPPGYVPKQSRDSGHYHVVIGNVIADRYTILNLLGEGTFAKVVECKDNVDNRVVAVKVVRSVREYLEDAKFEIDMLSTVRRHDPEDRRPCIKMLKYFAWNNHMCIVFEKKGPSLLDFMQKNRTPFVPEDLAAIARQMCRVLEFLRSSCGLVHTDLKPENVLLEEPGVAWNHKLSRKVPKSNRIRVVDFGGATKNGQHVHSIISTRHYRAPEVVLCTGWGFPADMWSLGCILAELYTGKLLFDTHDNREHLAMMEKTLGPIPKDMFKQIYRDPESLVVNNAIAYPQNWDTCKGNLKSRRLQDWVSEPMLLDLLSKMLHYDKNQRMTPTEALKHPFLTQRTTVPHHITASSTSAPITASGSSSTQPDKTQASTALQEVNSLLKQGTSNPTTQRTLAVLNTMPHHGDEKDKPLRPAKPANADERENMTMCKIMGTKQMHTMAHDKLRAGYQPAQKPRSYHHGPFAQLFTYDQKDANIRPA